MSPDLVDGLLIAVSLAAWWGVYGLALLVTRPAGVDAAPATPDLGPEPPAVVSLLAGGWEITEDAAEATLLDLGARRYLELRQPAGDPAHTTVHVREPDPAGLNPYERRVFDRVAGLAVDGVLPLTALTFRNEAAAKSWEKLLRAEVVADARARGLSRARFTPGVLGVLSVAAALAGAVVAVAAWRVEVRSADPDLIAAAVGGFLITFSVLTAFAARSVGERDTPAGREAAARWLGVRDWLKAHEAFADLPPSAVAVWDRYLPYGAAVGATRLASAVTDLGMGDRRRVWSSFGGTWRRVRVRYPRLWARYGKTAPRLLVRAAIALALGYALVRFWRQAVGDLAGLPQASGAASAADPVSTAGFGIGVALLGYGAYLAVRTLIDLAAPATLTGQVLWRQVWRSTNGGENMPPRPWLHYLAVDDGRSDRTTAWGMPEAMAALCRDGDTVTLTARRWSRRVTSLRLVERGSPGLAVTPAAGGERTQSPGAPAVTAAELLSADEVGRALGVEIKLGERPVAGAGPVVLGEFKNVGGTTVLMLVVSGGLAARLAIRARRRYPPLPGVGDEAYAGEDWAVARRGDTVIMLTTRALGRRPDPRGMHWLLSQAVGRLPAPVG